MTYPSDDRPALEITDIPRWDEALGVLAGFEDEVLSASEAILELWGLWFDDQSGPGRLKAASPRP